MNDFLERTLEDIIFENKDRIHERGFIKFLKNTERQFPLPSGKRVDILTWEVTDNVLHAKVIELKKDELFESAFWQVMEYVGELVMAMADRFDDFYITPIICGRGLSLNITKLSFLDGNIEVYSYDYGYDGISFSEEVKHYSISEIKAERRTKEVAIAIREVDMPLYNKLIAV